MKKDLLKESIGFGVAVLIVFGLVVTPTLLSFITKNGWILLSYLIIIPFLTGLAYYVGNRQDL